jgi:uncharacterized protein YpmS
MEQENLNNLNQNLNSDLSNSSFGGKNKKKIWMYVVAFVIVLLIVFMAYEIFKTKPNSEPSNLNTNSEVANLENQSSSDNVADIEKDLNATDLNGLDSELQDIDNALK